DDSTSFRLLEAMLKKAGYSVLRAVDGEEALQAVRENPDVALVLMDVKMPGMNGLEATRRIRRFNTVLPIIAQTAYAFPEDRTKALEAGCDDYISKPVERTALLKMIKRYCERKDA
ncbi:MAG TPA: response regulator, partial [Synergistales bacterium]|nr:response regulator [Synergistales bacterium]